MKIFFVCVSHFEFFFFSKKIYFCFIPIQISHNLCDSKDGTKFSWLPWFPAKSSEMITIVSHWIKKLQLYVRTNILMSLYLCTYWFLQHKIIRSSQQHWQIKNSLYTLLRFGPFCTFFRYFFSVYDIFQSFFVKLWISTIWLFLYKNYVSFTIVGNYTYFSLFHVVWDYILGRCFGMILLHFGIEIYYAINLF